MVSFCVIVRNIYAREKRSGESPTTPVNSRYMVATTRSAVRGPRPSCVESYEWRVPPLPMGFTFEPRRVRALEADEGNTQE